MFRLSRSSINTLSSALVVGCTLFHRTNVSDCSTSESRNSFGSHTYPANDPIEDRMIFGKESEWIYGAVFDGHGGWQVSEKASKDIMKTLFGKLSRVENVNDVLIDKCIIEAFDDTEKDIIRTIRPSFQMGFGEVAKVGSCVLIALKKDSKLIIANCGDCRAVLGSERNGTFYAAQINRDHNCRVPFEQHFLQNAHPGEPDLVRCKSSHACYVKGRLQLTRSLGDAYLKYREFNGSPDKGRSSGRFIPEPYTPPYVLHVPDIHHIKLQQEDRFVILGSDGLWDYLSDVEAVKIVEKGLKMNLDSNTISKLLVEEALKIAAHESGLSYDDLRKLSPGRYRRGVHDDTTAVVMFL